MKKITALVALALLAIAGTGYAVTCAQDNVPAATLLVPYFRVGGTGTVLPNDIPDSSGTDTLCAVTNVSNANIIIHVTVWNKYSKPVLDFNVPMTGYDVVFWSMRDILNGKLIVNPAYQAYATFSGGIKWDPCGQVYIPGLPTDYDYTTGFLRFSALDASDRIKSISVYPTPAFTGAFRTQVWTSLDESYDITNWIDVGARSTGIIDDDNPVCSSTYANNTVSGDFSGYVTIDLANNCTQHFPDDNLYWENDSIATIGWGRYPGTNILVGDIFYKDQKPGDTTANIGNISGDPMVHVEFDSRLYWGPLTAGSKTFYRRYYDATDTFLNQQSFPAFSFPGDGREPLGMEYTFRYLQTAAPTALRTWITVWRSDTYPNDTTTKNLCAWWVAKRAGSGASVGFTDSVHDITVNLWDNDENVVSTSGGPSGGPTGSKQYIYLEAQRLVVTPNALVVPSSFLGGWVDLVLPGNSNEQAFVGVQHSGMGLAMSVGHAAQLKPGNGNCVVNPTMTFTSPLPAVPGVFNGGGLVQTN